NHPPRPSIKKKKIITPLTGRQGKMAATSPSAAPPATAGDCPHPTYTEMITQALTELGGTSGRIAIAAFILSRFTGLPATHDKLLKANLRRLVSEGVVRGYGSKSRSCYVFPASDTRGRGRPSKPNNKDLSDLDLEDDTTATPLPKNLNLHESSEMIWPARQRRNSGSGSGSQPQQNYSDPGLDGFQSNSSSGEDDVDDDEYTPHKRGTGRPRKILRGRGRPRKDEQQSQSQAKHPPTPTATASSTGGMQQSEAEAAAAEPRKVALSANGDAASPSTKSGRGRPRKIPGGRGRPRKEADKGGSTKAGPPAPAASAGVKRSRGRPRVYRPMPVKTGDELENPVSVDVALENPRMHRPSSADIVSMVMKRGIPAKARDARPAEAGDAIPAKARYARPAEAGDATPAEETGGAASTGIKRPRGRPRKEKPAAAMSAQAGDAVSAGIKRGRGRPRKK
uniref:H15 domain-containing protein n=1 Tax=Aegilops tauschii subsp. strangulata TaxID=200361 RepID=A0A453LW08_AEGTS